jgi:hypothetical protein
VNREFAFLLIVSCLPAFGQWKAIGPSTVVPTIPITNEQGNAAIQSREFVVQAPPEKGKPDRGEILLYFDPVSRFFLWRFAPVINRPSDKRSGDFTTPLLGAIHAESKQAAVFAGHDGIFLFESMAGAIRVVRSVGTASSLDDAQSQALQLLGADLGSASGLGIMRPKATMIDYVPLLSRTLSASMYRLQIESVTRQQNNWQFIMQGFNKLIRIDVDSSWKVTAATVLSTLPGK